MKRSLIISTRDYQLFYHDDDNRPLNMAKRGRLRESMSIYGFIKAFPIVCRMYRGRLYVKDGQHRLAVAQELGLAVFYVVEETDFDVATINNTQRVWNPMDYAQTFAARGVSSYQEALQFIDTHNLPVGLSFAMLGGTVTFNNIAEAFRTGKFEIRDREYAESVATVYRQLVDLSHEVKGARLLKAVTMICRVPGLDTRRLIKNARRWRDALVSYSTVDLYLELLDDLYNRGRGVNVPLRSAAINAVRERSPIGEKSA